MSAVFHESGKQLTAGPEYWARCINESWRKSVSGILETAKLVREALDDGVHQDDLAPLLLFNQGTLSKLNRIGSDQRLYSHVNILPQSYGTLYELTQLDDEQWAVAEGGGGKGGLPLLRPDVERKEITYFRNYQSRGVKSPPPLPKGKYRVIYADPPWQYEYSISDSRAIENQYPTMELEDIQKLLVADICAPDCVLFMWATSPKLAEAISVIDAWGFTYKTCAVWDKQKIGMGYYFRQQHELLLVATVGSPAAPEAEDRPSSVFSAPRGKHSAKPAEVLAAIETMYPPAESSHIELFCRERRESWSAWGNQVA